MIPAYNEEDGLPLLRAALEAWTLTQPWATEVIIVNDGSADGTGLYLEEWAAKCPWLKAVHLSRNFGQQAAITAGLDHAGGEVTVIIDADLQDPLEAIGPMVRKYCEGFDVVYGQRTNRQGENAGKRLTAWLFYRLMQRLVLRSLPLDAGDFRLVSRRCLQAIRSMRETHRFLRGMFSWVGFSQAAVPYVRHSRQAGTTKYPYRKMLRFAWGAILSFSPLPLRFILFQGFALGGLGGGYGLFLALRWALTGQPVAGWPVLIVLLALIGGAILVALGLIGEYLGRIYDELKGRPLYIISSTRNLRTAEPLRAFPHPNEAPARS